jgi:uncharacterized membrane protein YccC
VRETNAVQKSTVLDLGPQLFVSGGGLLSLPLQGELLHLSDRAIIGSSIGTAASVLVVEAGSPAFVLVFFCLTLWMIS